MSRVLQGSVFLPGDKSISHRALMLLGISPGSALIQNLSAGQDVHSTLRCMEAIGVTIEPMGSNAYRVVGTRHLNPVPGILDCGNSGTTIRLLSGLLAGANVNATLTGDESLQKRPMKRVIDPLSKMGLSIEAMGANGSAPLHLNPHSGKIQSINYQLPMASAQVKSAVLLAGLYADREATITIEEPLPSRDHTERMLNAMGVGVQRTGSKIRLLGRIDDLQSTDILVPGDISSGAFWLVGAGILPGSQVVLKQVGLNPHRTGLLEVFRSLKGLKLEIQNESESCGEPYGDICLQTQSLSGNIQIQPEQVPALIDEIPILTILGLFTDGIFCLKGAEELRYKESDRLESMIRLLKRLGVSVDAYCDGYSFHGNPHFRIPEISTPIETFHDHRLVMALEILNLRANSPIPIAGKEWAAVSYPNFFETLEQLCQHQPQAF